MTHIKNQKAFTIVELIAVIGDTTFSTGKQGFGTYFDKNMHFDNFTVRYP